MKAVIFMTLTFAAALRVESTSSTSNETNEYLEEFKYCFPKHGCDLEESTRSCSCDERCEMFGDCCYDKPISFKSKDDSWMAQCLEKENGEGVNTVVMCKENWDHQDWTVINKCEGDGMGDWSDPLLNIPLTNKHTGVTYKNYYCAICNEDQDNSTMWQVYLQNGDDQEAAILSSKIKASTLWKHLVFDKNRQEWGVWAFYNSTRSFYSLKIYSKMPKNLSFRHCMPNLLSSCLPNWPDQEEQRQCNAYLSPIYSSQRGFKNAHCAICNNVDMKTIICDVDKDIGIQTKKTPEIDFASFSVLLDMNPVSYKTEKEVSCSPEDIWDPFSKQCRNIKCGNQNYRLEEDGRCHPINKDLLLNDPIYNDNVSDTSILFQTNLTGYSEDFINCIKIPINSLDYQMYENRSIRLLSSNLIINETSYIILEQGTYVCMDELNIEKSQTMEEYSSQFQDCIKSFYPKNEFIILPNETALIESSNAIFNEYIVFKEKLFVCDDSYPFYDYIDDTKFTPDFLLCGKVTVPQNEYVLFPNGTLYIPLYQRYYNSSQYFLWNETQTVRVCHPEEELKVNKFKVYERYITLIGISISIVCIILHLSTFCFVSEMRNLPGLNLASLCVALLIAYSSFLCIRYRGGNKVFCLFIALFVQYFFLASFFWMNTISFDVWRSLYMATSTLRVSGRSNKVRRFTIYSLYSWISPLVIMAITLLFEYLPGINTNYRAEYGKPLCWINNRMALFYFFGLPLVILLVSNIFFFVYSSIIIVANTLKSGKDDSSPPRRNYKLYIRLAIMMGLNWMTGFIATALDSKVIFLVFIVFNTLQGLLIFLGFTCSNTGVKRIWRKTFKYPFKSSTSLTNDHSNVASTAMTTRY